MKRILTFILLFVSLALVAKNDSPIVQQAEKIAEEYYSMFQQLAQLPDPLEEEGTKLEDSILKLVGSDNNGNSLSTDLRVSNDIEPVFFGSINPSMKSDVTMSNYIGHFKEYASKYAFNFSYKILSCEPLDASSEKGMDDFKYAKVKARKTFSAANIFIDVDESIGFAFTKDGHFVFGIHNSYGSAQSSGDLFTQALEYYSKRQYNEALAMFEKQIELFRDPKAYYHAALMYLNKEGCRDMKRRDREDKAVEYLMVLKRQWNEITHSIINEMGEIALNSGDTNVNASFELMMDENAKCLVKYFTNAVSILAIYGIY